MGKACSGKSKVIALLSEQISHHVPRQTTHTETLGIHVKDIYWPAQMYEKICLFRLTFWDSGESCSKRFNYISTVSLLLPLTVLTFLTQFFFFFFKYS